MVDGPSDNGWTHSTAPGGFVTLPACLLGLLIAATACVIPPPEIREQDNLPPRIDWSLTQPSLDEPVFNRTTEDRIEFRIDEAVTDPEGDPLYVLWYWEAPDGVPTAVFGTGTMELRPCDSRKLANASPGQYVAVKVLVSDGRLTWTGDPDDDLPATFPDGFEVARRVWYMKLLGECR